MTTATVLSGISAGYHLDQAPIIGESLQPARELQVAPLETASVRVRPISPAVTRYADLRKKVLRRLRGFVIEIGREEVKVGFVEDGNTYEYYLPASPLEKAGIRAESQPFQMDEVEIKTEGGVIVGYEFRPLAKPSDAFRDSFELDGERERKRNLIFKIFRDAEA